MKVYTVYDSAVQAYDKPFVLRNKGEALRSWQEVANNKETMICKRPSEFTLFEIGEWDDLTGVISLYETKMSLGLAADFQKASQ